MEKRYQMPVTHEGGDVDIEWGDKVGWCRDCKGVVYFVNRSVTGTMAHYRHGKGSVCRTGYRLGGMTRHDRVIEAIVAELAVDPEFIAKRCYHRKVCGRGAGVPEVAGDGWRADVLIRGEGMVTVVEVTDTHWTTREVVEAYIAEGMLALQLVIKGALGIGQACRAWEAGDTGAFRSFVRGQWFTPLDWRFADQVTRTRDAITRLGGEVGPGMPVADMDALLARLEAEEDQRADARRREAEERLWALRREQDKREAEAEAALQVLRQEQAAKAMQDALQAEADRARAEAQAKIDDAKWVLQAEADRVKAEALAEMLRALAEVKRQQDTIEQAAAVKAAVRVVRLRRKAARYREKVTAPRKAERDRRRTRAEVALKLKTQWETMRPDSRENLAKLFLLSDEAFDEGRLTPDYAKVAVRNPWRPSGWRDLTQPKET